MRRFAEFFAATYLRFDPRSLAESPYGIRGDGVVGQDIQVGAGAVLGYAEGVLGGGRWIIRRVHRDSHGGSGIATRRSIVGPVGK